jgi:peptidoglycan-associated lipoprotein
MKTILRTIALSTVVAGVLLTGACAKKKVAQAPPTPPPPPAAPTVSLNATPDTITASQAATLTWNTTNASTVTISGLGTVAASGSKQVTPSDSITYDLTAKGPGGERDASARVTVTRPVAKVQAGPDDAELFARNIKDVYFDFDRYTIRADQANITAADAKFLNEHPNMAIVIEGHCDDRGSDEYNLALGDSRANAVKAELIKLGVDANRIKTISYGKEKPFCTADDGNCWSQNRRDHFNASLH